MLAARSLFEANAIGYASPYKAGNRHALPETPHRVTAQSYGARPRPPGQQETGEVNGFPRGQIEAITRGPWGKATVPPPLSFSSARSVRLARTCRERTRSFRRLLLGFWLSFFRAFSLMDDQRVWSEWGASFVTDQRASDDFEGRRRVPRTGSHRRGSEVNGMV